MDRYIVSLDQQSIIRRAALYVRVSTQDQSCDLQRIELLSFLDTKGWKLFEIYEDKATGTNANRPMLQKLLSDARDKKFDVIICWKLDRLFRSLKDLIITLQVFNELGIDFISHRDNLDLTSSTGRLMAHIIGAFAEFEAAIVKERVKAGLAAAKAKGRYPGRPKTRPSELIQTLRRNGHSYEEIAKLAKVSCATVHIELKESGFLKIPKGDVY